LPLACAPGNDCWIANQVDVDPGPEALDYTCGGFTYQGHNGVDFAVRDLAEMTKGVAVLAAAAGTVAALRDGMPDANVRARGEASVKGRECGNGVRLAHDGGWETQYCHLRRGSLAVRRGERVEAGQRLGLVGMSGLAEFPHLHFTVRQRSETIEPFTGAHASAGCGQPRAPLWDAAALAALPYAPGALYNAGIASRVPEPAEARSGALRGRTLAADAPAIVVWMEAFGVRAGDRLHIRVEAPGEEMFFDRRMKFDKAQARIFRAAGRRRGAANWPAGSYRVTIALENSSGRGLPQSSAHFTFEVR
jgi:murein DD-endopeptidase MepM/ murein hydrolase activator NlpD